MTSAVKTAAVSLTQEEANLVLRAMELLGEAFAGSAEAFAGSMEAEHVETIDKIWNKVFDAGLEQGFGTQAPDVSVTPEIDVFDLPVEDDVTGYPV